MTIGKKIQSGFGLSLAIVVLIGVLSYWAVSRLIDTGHAVAHTHQVLERLEKLLSLLRDAESSERGYVLIAEAPYLKPYREAVAALEPTVEDVRRLTADNPTQQGRINELKQLLDDRLRELRAVIDARDRHRDDEKKALEETRRLIREGAARNVTGRLRALLDRMKDDELQLLRERDEGAETTARLARFGIAGGTALAVVLAAVAGLFITRSITGPVREAVQQLTSAGAEILASTTEQAAGAQQQAAAVAQTVATVDQVTQTAEQSAQRARGVGEAVQRTQEVGKSGRKVVEESLAAMATVRQQTEATAETIVALAEQAQQIGEIIATVNDIAEQTNLLALNAAIEASRAGEHGRGFAVVASEVRSLADQSRKATAQVRQILGEIQKATGAAVSSAEEVTKGVADAIRVGGQAAETIRTLAEALSEASRSAAQIVASVGQQATGMAQIHQAMRNVDQVAKQSAAATRQAAQAAENLNRLGTRLTALTAG